MYKLRGIQKSYKKRGVSRTALQQVDLDLPNTGLFAIVGESGSGKSTLLNMLSCLTAPDKGTIQIEGRDASKFSDSQRCGFTARDVGFAFQKDELVAHASLLENMQASFTLSGSAEREVVEKATSALEHAGLLEYKNCLPEQLSQHQLRRFSLARAMCKGAKVLLLDEPEVGLTESERVSLIQEIKSASTSSLVVVATRDAGFAAALGAEIVNIEDGVVDHVEAKPVAPGADTGCTPSSEPHAVAISLSSKLGFVHVSLRNRSGRSFFLRLPSFWLSRTELRPTSTPTTATACLSSPFRLARLPSIRRSSRMPFRVMAPRSFPPRS